MCLCAAEGEGQAADSTVLCSAVEQAGLSLCATPTVSLSLALFRSLSAGLGLLCLSEHCWQ